MTEGGNFMKLGKGAGHGISNAPLRGHEGRRGQGLRVSDAMRRRDFGQWRKWI